MSQPVTNHDVLVLQAWQDSGLLRLECTLLLCVWANQCILCLLACMQAGGGNQAFQQGCSAQRRAAADAHPGHHLRQQGRASAHPRQGAGSLHATLMPHYQCENVQQAYKRHAPSQDLQTHVLALTLQCLILLYMGNKQCWHSGTIQLEDVCCELDLAPYQNRNSEGHCCTMYSFNGMIQSAHEETWLSAAYDLCQVVSRAMLASEKEQIAAYQAWPPLITLLACEKPLLAKRRTVRKTLISPILHTLHSSDSSAAVKQVGHVRTPPREKSQHPEEVNARRVTRERSAAHLFWDVHMPLAGCLETSLEDALPLRRVMTQAETGVCSHAFWHCSAPCAHSNGPACQAQGCRSSRSMHVCRRRR